MAIEEIRCKRIIDGKTYNTETSTKIADPLVTDEGPGSLTQCLYQNRLGAFFKYCRLDFTGEDDFEKIVPLSAEEARIWIEEQYSWRTDLIESLFGEMPEAGVGEVKFTLRMPETLRSRLSALAKEQDQSLNAWMVRCLERCANQTIKPEKPRRGKV